MHQSRPGESEQLGALTTRIQWSDWFTTYLGGSGGGPNDPNAFFPRFRYDLNGILKTPVPGLLLTGGYTRLYYGRPVSGRIARGGVILYLGKVVLQGILNHNNVRPGNRGSLSGLMAIQYGQEGRYWVGGTAGGGKEAWQTLGAAPADVEFDGYNVSLFVRKWFTPSFGAVATYNYNIRKTAYQYNGVELRLFWQF